MDLWHALQKSLCLCDYWTGASEGSEEKKHWRGPSHALFAQSPCYWNKSDGVFGEIKIISCSLVILKNIQMNSQFLKLLMLKVRLQFLGQSVEALILILEKVLNCNGLESGQRLYRTSSASKKDYSSKSSLIQIWYEVDPRGGSSIFIWGGGGQTLCAGESRTPLRGPLSSRGFAALSCYMSLIF